VVTAHALSGMRGSLHSCAAAIRGAF